MVNRAGCFMGIFVLIGLSLMAVGLGGWVIDRGLRSSALRTQGSVVRMERQREGSGRVPVVQYRIGAQSYEVNGTVYSSPPAYHVGESVTILYRSEKPEGGRIDSFLEQDFLPLLFGGLGAVFFLIGVFGGKLFGRR